MGNTGDEHVSHRHGKRTRFRSDHEDTAAAGLQGNGGSRHGRGKRLRREPSAASITMLFSEHKKSAEEHVKRMESVETDSTPEYVRNEVTKVVYRIRNAKPVGGKAHLAAVHALRHILSTYEEPPCKAAVEAGAIPVLVEALQPPQMDSTALETTFQAAWALTNLAVGDADVVRAILPAAPILIAHVGGDNGLAMAEQCAWAIGNIAEEDVEYRGILISNGAVMPLTKLLLKACSVFRAKDADNAVLDSESLSAGETAAWALSILFVGEGDEVKPFLEAEHGMETLVSVVSSTSAPISLVKEVAWLLARMTSACPGDIRVGTHEAILQNAFKWIRFVLDPDQEFDEERDGSALKIPCLRVMGNVTIAHPRVASEFFCDAQEGVNRSQIITLCAESRQYGVQREALWILSCIAALPDSNTYQMLRQAHTIPVLMKCLKEEPYHIKKEAAFALANLCLGKDKKGDPEVLNHLFGGDNIAVGAMLSLMHSADLDAIELSLDFASMMLHRLPEGKDIIQQAEGIKLLEEVQFNAGISSDTLKKRAKHLVNHYWGIDDDRMKHHDR